MDALATWLVEDTARLEPRLLSRDVTNRFVALLAAYTPCGAFSTRPRRRHLLSMSLLDSIMVQYNLDLDASLDTRLLAAVLGPSSAACASATGPLKCSATCWP